MGVPLTLRRIVPRVGTLPLLLAISAAVFALLHLVPGGPLAVYLSNPDVRPEDLERLKRALGLDQPVWRQYLAAGSRVSSAATGASATAMDGRSSIASSSACRRPSSWSAPR